MRLEALLPTLLEAACAEALGHPTVQEVELPRSVVANGFVGLVGFSSPTQRGHVGLSVPADLARRLHPLPREAREPLLSDHVGELANLLIGRLKAAFGRYGVDVWAGTPVVLRGVDLSVGGAADARVHACRVECAWGTLYAWIDARHPQGLDVEVDPIPTGEAEIGTGTQLLF